jgi:zona occludens toxin (predicted ATPase)
MRQARPGSRPAAGHRGRHHGDILGVESSNLSRRANKINNLIEFKFKPGLKNRHCVGTAKKFEDGAVTVGPNQYAASCH